MMQAFETLTELALVDGQALTACGTDLAMLYADVATGYPATVALKEQTVVINGQAAIPSAAPVLDCDLNPFDLHIQLLIDRATEWLPELDLKDKGMLITSPEILTHVQLQQLGLREAAVTLQAPQLHAALGQWQNALQQHPRIEHWYWLSLDSRCYLQWLQQHSDQLFSVLDQPEGQIPGEAIVITHWQRGGTAGYPLSFAACQPAPRQEPGGATRTTLLSAAEPEIKQRPPVWAEIISNDDLSRASAVEIYHSEAALWPEFDADLNRGPAEPVLSLYRTLGDIGLAALPLALLLARSRIHSPMQYQPSVGVMINDGQYRHYWRLTDQHSEPRKHAHV